MRLARRRVAYLRQSLSGQPLRIRLASNPKQKTWICSSCSKHCQVYQTLSSTRSALLSPGLSIRVLLSPALLFPSEAACSRPELLQTLAELTIQGARGQASLTVHVIHSPFWRRFACSSFAFCASSSFLISAFLRCVFTRSSDRCSLAVSETLC